MPNEDYYNTNGETGEVLSQSKIQAKDQQAIILRIFQQYPDVLLAPHEVMDLLVGRVWPITSVRRAMTNLTEDGKLVKTGRMRPGPYGKRVHTWVLAATDAKQ